MVLRFSQTFHLDQIKSLKMILLVLSFVIGAILMKFFLIQFQIAQIKIPSLIGVPVLDFIYSNYLFLFGSIEKRQKIFNNLLPNYDKFFKIWFGHILGIVITGPEQIKKVLSSSKCSEKFHLFYEFIDTKNSLVSGSMLHRWPVSRKFCNASFSPISLQSMRVIFEKNGKALERMIELKVSENKEFDMLKLTTPISVEIFSKVFLGLSGYEETQKFIETLKL